MRGWQARSFHHAEFRHYLRRWQLDQLRPLSGQWRRRVRQLTAKANGRGESI